MNCDDRTCPWYSTQLSTGHCSHPTPTLCKKVVMIKLTRPIFERLKESHFDYCQHVYYTSEKQISHDTDDMNLAVKILLDELAIFNAWMSGELG